MFSMMPPWMSESVPSRVITRPRSTTVRYAAFSRTRSSWSGTSSSRAVAKAHRPAAVHGSVAIDVAARELELELRAELLARLFPSIRFDGVQSAPQPGSHPSWVIWSFSVRTLVSPALSAPISRLFGHALVELVALELGALEVVDDDRAALAGAGHVAEVRLA